jgi:hypothetical protein
LSPMMFMVAIPASQIRDRATPSLHVFSAQHNRRPSIIGNTRCIPMAARAIGRSILVEMSIGVPEHLANVLLFPDFVGTRAIRVAYYD